MHRYSRSSLQVLYHRFWLNSQQRITDQKRLPADNDNMDAANSQGKSGVKTVCPH
jgi:hypothetical protein